MAESTEARQKRVAAEAARIRARASGDTPAAPKPSAPVTSSPDKQTSGTKSIDLSTAFSRISGRDKELRDQEAQALETRSDNQSTDSSQ